MKPDQVSPWLCSFTWFANLQQQNWWQLNRMEFISGLEIVLAVYGFPAERLQIRVHLVKLQSFAIQPLHQFGAHHGSCAAVIWLPSARAWEPSCGAESPSKPQKLLPGQGFAGPAPQTARTVCLQDWLTNIHL